MNKHYSIYFECMPSIHWLHTFIKIRIVNQMMLKSAKVLFDMKNAINVWPFSLIVVTSNNKSENKHLSLYFTLLLLVSIPWFNNIMGKSIWESTPVDPSVGAHLTIRKPGSTLNPIGGATRPHAQGPRKACKIQEWDIQTQGVIN